MHLHCIFKERGVIFHKCKFGVSFNLSLSLFLSWSKLRMFDRWSKDCSSSIIKTIIVVEGNDWSISLELDRLCWWLEAALALNRLQGWTCHQLCFAFMCMELNIPPIAQELDIPSCQPQTVQLFAKARNCWETTSPSLIPRNTKCLSQRFLV